MSYAVPASSGEKRRPPVVTIAGYLLFLAAILLVIGAILPLPYLSKMADAAREAYASQHSTQPTPEAGATAERLGLIAAAVVGVVLAVLFAVIGSLVLRGNRVGRILAWVFGGLGALCTVCLSAGALASGRVTTTTVNGVDMKAVNDKVSAAAPSWLKPTQTAMEVIALLALIAVIILLAMPQSNAYFRKEQPTFDPALPDLPYPPAPGGGSANPGAGPGPGPTPPSS